MKKLKHSDVTPETYYINRRNFIAGSSIFSSMIAYGLTRNEAEASISQLTPNSFKEITNYNNFYEFGTSKTDPAKYSKKLTTIPWQLEVDGLTNKKKHIRLEKILNNIPLEERIYRLRCVEGWSMVIPWIGFPLKKLDRSNEPKNEARYVAFFETLYRPEEMRGQDIIYLMTLRRRVDNRGSYEPFNFSSNRALWKRVTKSKRSTLEASGSMEIWL